MSLDNNLYEKLLNIEYMNWEFDEIEPEEEKPKQSRFRAFLKSVCCCFLY